MQSNITYLMATGASHNLSSSYNILIFKQRTTEPAAADEPARCLLSQESLRHPDLTFVEFQILAKFQPYLASREQLALGQSEATDDLKGVEDVKPLMLEVTFHQVLMTECRQNQVIQ